MDEVRVIAPPSLAPGFALGGSRTVAWDASRAASRAASGAASRAEEGGSAAALSQVVEEVAARAAVVLVHHSLWDQLPRTERDAWSERTDVLVMALPPDDGAPGAHEAALHRLLARAVGYEISFTTEGGPA